MVGRAYPFRNLEREQFDAIVRMLAEGFTTKRGRRSTYLHHDAVNQRLRGRRGARLAAITSGGAIPDTADYAVVLEPTDLVDRKSTRLNSSHGYISYAVFCLKKKKQKNNIHR